MTAVASSGSRGGAGDWLADVPPAAAADPRPFVTISRLAGAGGSAVADRLVRLLAHDRDVAGDRGWQVHDADVCGDIAADPALASRLEDLVREVYRPGLEDHLDRTPRPEGAQPIPVYRVFRTVRRLAQLGRGVIVGRAGVMLTRDLPLGVHLRLIAPREMRLQTLCDRYRLSRADGLAALTEQDSSRARLFLEYFQREIDDPMLYDAVFNTARVDLGTIAASIAQIVRDRLTESRVRP